MKDLIDDTRDPAPRRVAPPAASALAARQGGSAPDSASFAAKLVTLAQIAPPRRLPATPHFSPEAEPAVVADLIEAMRPMFHRDGGDIELLAFAGATVRVRLSGSCAGCLLSARTLATVQDRLTQTLGRALRVIPEARQ